MQRSMARPKPKPKQNLTNVEQRKARRGVSWESVSTEKRYIRYMGNSPGQSVMAFQGCRYIRYIRYRPRRLTLDRFPPEGT